MRSLLASFVPRRLTILVRYVMVNMYVVLTCTIVTVVVVFVRHGIYTTFRYHLKPVHMNPRNAVRIFTSMFGVLVGRVVAVQRTSGFLCGLTPCVIVLTSVVTFDYLPVGGNVRILSFGMNVFFLLTTSDVNIMNVLLTN